MKRGKMVRNGPAMILNDRGMPWTVGLSLGWTVVLALFSGGAVFLALGLYLANWVRTKQGRSAAFWCYIVITTLVVLMLVPKTVAPSYLSSLFTSICVLWVLAALVLRAEIISLYRRSHGLKLAISPLLTILFSSVYLNYCVPDLPVNPSDAIVPARTA